MSRHSVRSLLAAPIFLVAAVAALKAGRLISIRGDTVKKEECRAIFVVCVGCYFVIAAFLTAGIFVG